MSDDDELDFAAVVFRCVPAATDEDDRDDELVLAAAVSERDPRARKRAFVAKMRRARGQNQRAGFASHAAEQLEYHNRASVSQHGNVMDLCETKRKRWRLGFSKVWTPVALLISCFGRPLRASTSRAASALRLQASRLDRVEFLLCIQ